MPDDETCNAIRDELELLERKRFEIQMQSKLESEPDKLDKLTDEWDGVSEKIEKLWGKYNKCVIEK